MIAQNKVNHFHKVTVFTEVLIVNSQVVRSAFPPLPPSLANKHFLLRGGALSGQDRMLVICHFHIFYICNWSGNIAQMPCLNSNPRSQLG